MAGKNRVKVLLFTLSSLVAILEHGGWWGEGRDLSPLPVAISIDSADITVFCDINFTS